MRVIIMYRVLRRSLTSLLAGLCFVLFAACQSVPASETASPQSASPIASRAAAIQLPALPYSANALEPYIDAATMKLHHDKHHAAYVNKLNEALQPYPDLQAKTVADLLQSLDSLPKAIRKTVQNNGGGHLNHSMFWNVMAPQAGGTARGEVGQAITAAFGSFDTFKQKFVQAGVNQFGSGWVWLVLTPQGQLQITTTSNQDSPVMQGNYPILGNDLWEHAYYLKYNNRRQEYLENWWNVVNWPEIERRFVQAKKIQLENAPK